LVKQFQLQLTSLLIKIAYFKNNYNNNKENVNDSVEKPGNNNEARAVTVDRN